MSVWQSRAHMERWQAEQLFPAFQAAGMAAGVPANTEFTEYEAGELYIRLAGNRPGSGGLRFRREPGPRPRPWP